MGIAWTSNARAAPEPGGGELRARVQLLLDRGEYEQALAVITPGLASSAKDYKLLFLKGAALRKLHDYLGALEAYEAGIAAGAVGGDRRKAREIIKTLEPARSTSLTITSAGGKARIYLDDDTQRVFCTAAPVCTRPALPRSYRVNAERPGFDRWTGRVVVKPATTTALPIALVEKRSMLTVRVAQPDARITVDDTVYTAPLEVAAGTHQVVVSLAGHERARRVVTAREGKPVELDVALTPLVPLRVAPAGATLTLDGKGVVPVDGHIALPPGAHRMVARAAGFQDTAVDIQAARPPGYALVIELARTPPVAEHPGFPVRRKVALTLAGLGVTIAAGGVALGVGSERLKDDAFALCPSPSTPCGRAAEADSLFERGRSRAVQADLAYGAAAAAAIAAAVLWFTGEPEARVAVTPRLGAVAGVDLAVRF